MEPVFGVKPMSPMKPMEPMKALARWWPEELGEHPSSAGGQNEMRYAYFGDQHRLAVDTGDGTVQVYDTGDYRISSVQSSFDAATQRTYKQISPLDHEYGTGSNHFD